MEDKQQSYSLFKNSVLMLEIIKFNNKLNWALESLHILVLK